MFNIIKDCILINLHDCCNKSIDTLSKELSNAASNDLFICHVNIVRLSKNIYNLEEFLDKFSRKIEIICFSETKLTDAKLNS